MPSWRTTPLHFGFDIAALPNALPPFGKWWVLTGVSLSPNQGGYDVKGDSTQFGYQLMSPPIDVPPQRVMLLRLRGRLDVGRVCVGALDSSQQHWVLWPIAPQAEYAFDTKTNSKIIVVLANCFEEAKGNPSSRLWLASGSYALVTDSHVR